MPGSREAFLDCGLEEGSVSGLVITHVHGGLGLEKRKNEASQVA